MNAEELGLTMVEHLEAIVAAEDALNDAITAQAARAVAEGRRVVAGKFNGYDKPVVVTDWHTGEHLGDYWGEAVFGADTGHTWPEGWVLFDHVSDPNYTDCDEHYAAEQRLHALTNSPFPWLNTWVALDEVDQIRQFLNTLQR